jgi:hypothetical protein
MKSKNLNGWTEQDRNIKQVIENLKNYIDKKIFGK